MSFERDTFFLTKDQFFFSFTFYVCTHFTRTHSSLINSCLSHGERGQTVSTQCAVRNEHDSESNETLTKHCHHYPIKDTNIVLVDVWGFKKNANYLNGEYQNILKAKFKSGQHMNDTSVSARDIHSEIDIVIFVVDYVTIAGSPINAIIEDYRPFIEEAYAQKCIVSFVVTKMDHADGLSQLRAEKDPEDTLSQMYEQKDFKKFRGAIRSHFKEIIVVPVINYEEGVNRKNKNVQKASGSLLDVLIEALMDKQQSQREGSSSETGAKQVTWTTIPCNVFEGETPIELSYYPLNDYK